MDRHGYKTWGVDGWKEIKDDEVVMIHSMKDLNGFRAGFLHWLRLIIAGSDTNWYARVTMLRDTSKYLEFVWDEIKDLKSMDDDTMPTMFLGLVDVRDEVIEDEPLDAEEEKIILLLSSYLPTCNGTASISDVIRFARSHSLDDARLALHRYDADKNTRLTEVESLLATGNAPLANGAL